MKLLRFWVLFWLSLCQLEFTAVAAAKAKAKQNKNQDVPGVKGKEGPSRADSKEAARLTKDGISHVQNQQLKEAKKSFLKAADLDFTNPKRWGNLARTQIDLGEFEGAFESVKKGLAIAPTDDMLVDSLKDIQKVMPGLVLDESLGNEDGIMEVEIDASLESVEPATNRKSKKALPQRKLDTKLKKLRKTTKSLIKPKLPPHAPKSDTSTVVGCQTTAGNVYFEVFKSWAPIGAERFLELVENKFFDSKVGLFRVVPNWVAQFGISGDPELSKAWEGKLIKDDKQWLKEGSLRFQKGFISFAGGGPNSRNTQLFISMSNQNQLGEAPHEVAFGRLLGGESFLTMDKWFSGYGELDVFGGKAPNPDKILTEGLSYLEADYGDLDYITHCEIIPDSEVKSGSERSIPDTPNIQTSLNKDTSVQGLRKRQKDVDYVRSVAAPPQPLPQYRLPGVREFHPDSKEGGFFWWLKRLREKIEEKRDERKQRNNDRYSLNPNELHVVDDFLSKEDRIEMREIVFRLKSFKPEEAMDVNTVYETDTNDAKNLVAFPPVFMKASEEEKEKLLNIIAKVADYANENLYLNSTIGAPHLFHDDVGMHLGIFAMYEYLPDQTGVRSTVSKHTDTDYNGRCLSAALHLDNFLNPELSYVQKKIKKKERQKYENEPIEGGVFQVMECTGEDTDCTGAIGEKLANMHDDGIFTGKDTLRPTEEAPYKPGQLVFFLPESPHAVTPLKRNTRALLFMWFHCHEFVEPPEKNHFVQSSIDRSTKRAEEERAAKLKANRAKKGSGKKKSAHGKGGTKEGKKKSKGKK